MNRRIPAVMLALCCFLAAAVPSLAAANVFTFAERSMTIREGESFTPVLRREGSYDGDGEIVYTSSKPEVASAAEDGTVTGTGKGTATISATLMRGGKRVVRVQMEVKVLRRVKKVTLNTTRMAVYDAVDPAIVELLDQGTDYRVIVIPAGSGVNLSAACTPEDASNRRVAFESSDVGVARISGTALRGVQPGECDLTVSSVQDPEVTETWHVLVIQPVKKIQITAPEKTVAAGSSLQLTAACLPENASIPEVTWSSANPAVATVDEGGQVNGIKRGSATITATATDGSRVSASMIVQVTQPVASLAFTQEEIPVIVGRSVQAKVTVLPGDASDKVLRWQSSDEEIATVQNGRITGKKAGFCTVTCTSRSDPDVSASVPVRVSQLVTKIENTTPKDQLSILVGETLDLTWNVLPIDATDKSLSFRSGYARVATVDETGRVTGVNRGTATIVATARDGSRKQGSVRVTVIQPVTGLHMQKPIYYVQRGGSATIRGVIEPRNANNQRVDWYSADESIASVRSNGTSTGRVYGHYSGVTTVTGVSEDGGFSDVTRIRVGNFNEAVMIEELEVDTRNRIRISIRNMSDELTLENVYYTIECFDMEGEPMVCNTDGKSTSFDGTYPYALYPMDRSSHGLFHFKDYEIDEPIGAVIMTVTGWRDSDGYTWTIPKDERVSAQWTNFRLLH